MVGNITVGTKPVGVAYDLGNGEMYITNFGDIAVSVINTSVATVTPTMPAGNGRQGVAYNSGNGRCT